MSNPSTFLVFMTFCIMSFLKVDVTAIIGGDKPIHPHSFPYQVSLIVNGKNICGGGIIAEQFILSAAHCTINDDGHFYNTSITVVAGTNNLLNLGADSTVINHVDMVYVPKEFDAPTVTSPADIAVLKLKRPLDLQGNQHLKYLALPDNQRQTYFGKKPIVAGFGWDFIEVVNGRDVGRNSDYQLRYAKVNILNRRNRYYCPAIKAAVQMCGRIKQRKYTKRGTCNGDSGSPLVLGSNAIGILSISPKACLENFTGAVYTRVSAYVNFIYNAMHDNINGIRVHSLP